MKKKCALVVLGCAVAIALAEGGLRLNQWFRSRVSRQERYDPFLGLNIAAVPKVDQDPRRPMNGTPGDPYWTESRAAHRTLYYPYYEWRRAYFSGDYINVSSNGIRRTWNKETAAPAPDVWCFGGSTMWGTAARDDFTIPSLLSKRLDESGVSCRVVNMGESGYVFLQEIVYLVVALARGKRPDVVVFYDGLNDFGFREPGIIANYWDRRMRFTDSAVPPTPAQVLFQGLTQARQGAQRLLYQHSLAYRFARDAAFGLAGRHSRVEVGYEAVAELTPKPSRRAFPDKVIEAQSSALADYYAAGVSLVQALAARHGFECLFFLQPSALSTDSPTADESQRQDDNASRLYRATVKRINDMRLPHVHDLSTIFNGATNRVFIDKGHIYETGNATVVLHMASPVIDTIARRISSSPRD